MPQTIAKSTRQWLLSAALMRTFFFRRGSSKAKRSMRSRPRVEPLGDTLNIAQVSPGIQERCAAAQLSWTRVLLDISGPALVPMFCVFG